MGKKALLIVTETVEERLESPINDLNFWEEFLMKKGYTIKVLKGQNATQIKILAQFKKIVSGIKPGDYLFLMYSGSIEDGPYLEEIYKDLSKLPSGIIFTGFIYPTKYLKDFYLQYSSDYSRKDGQKHYKTRRYRHHQKTDASIVIFSAHKKGNISCLYKNKRYGTLTAAFMDRYSNGICPRKLLKEMWYFFEDNGIYKEDSGPLDSKPCCSTGSEDAMSRVLF